MKPLGASDRSRLTAAEGWLETGNYIEANEELERIEAGLPGASRRAGGAMADLRASRKVKNGGGNGQRGDLVVWPGLDAPIRLVR